MNTEKTRDSSAIFSKFFAEHLEEIVKTSPDTVIVILLKSTEIDSTPFKFRVEARNLLVDHQNQFLFFKRICQKDVPDYDDENSRFDIDKPTRRIETTEFFPITISDIYKIYHEN